MSFIKANTEQKQEKEFSNRCSVEGCGALWSVHISGQKPKCSKHQWEKLPTNRPKKLMIDTWYDKEVF
jgi:hypothetical protein